MKKYIVFPLMIAGAGFLLYVLLAQIDISRSFVGVTAGIPVPPVIAPDGGSFKSSVTVTIAGAAGVTEIHYTTDNTAPSCSDTNTYGGPFPLRKDTVIRAVSCGGGGQSDEAFARFDISSGGSGGAGGTTSNPTEVPGGPECDRAVYPELCPPDAPATGAAHETILAPSYGTVFRGGESPFVRYLHYGDRGADVAELQRFLMARGYLAPGHVTGYFGTLTRSAVIAFQKREHIEPAAGYVGNFTIGRINALSGALPVLIDR